MGLNNIITTSCIVANIFAIVTASSTLVLLDDFVSDQEAPRALTFTVLLLLAFNMLLAFLAGIAMILIQERSRPRLYFRIALAVTTLHLLVGILDFSFATAWTPLFPGTKNDAMVLWGRIAILVGPVVAFIANMVFAAHWYQTMGLLSQYEPIVSSGLRYGDGDDDDAFSLSEMDQSEGLLGRLYRAQARAPTSEPTGEEQESEPGWANGPDDLARPGIEAAETDPSKIPAYEGPFGSNMNDWMLFPWFKSSDQAEQSNTQFDASLQYWHPRRVLLHFWVAALTLAVGLHLALQASRLRWLASEGRPVYGGDIINVIAYPLLSVTSVVYGAYIIVARIPPLQPRYRGWMPIHCLLAIHWLAGVAFVVSAGTTQLVMDMMRVLRVTESLTGWYIVLFPLDCLYLAAAAAYGLFLLSNGYWFWQEHRRISRGEIEWQMK